MSIHNGCYPYGICITHESTRCRADELVTVELMFDGTFGGLDPAQLAALTSCLVPVERSNVRGPPPLGAAASRLSRPTRLCSVTAAWILFRLWLASVLARCLRVCLKGPATEGRARNSLLSPQ